MGMDVDGKVGVLLTDGANEEASRPRLENTSHYQKVSLCTWNKVLLLTIFNAQHMSAHGNDLVDHADVVLKVVLLLGVKHVAAILESV
jgi:hypothetical protein